MFLKLFANKNQLPGFYISEALVENGLKPMKHHTLDTCEWVVEIVCFKLAVGDFNYLIFNYLILFDIFLLVIKARCHVLRLKFEFEQVIKF